MRPATAAEALRGLIRVRPHGWLTDPLPTSSAAAADRLHTALAHHGFRQASGAPLRVLKVHAHEASYNGELVAYALVGHCPALPGLLGSADASRSLLIDYIPHPVDFTAPAAVAELVGAVAAVHAAPTSLAPELKGAFDAFRLDRLAASSAPVWLPEPAPRADVIGYVRDAHGGDAIPVGHLDLKSEHARRREGGALVLVDLETLRPDITPLIDLVTLGAFLRQAGRPLPGADVLALYRDAADQHGITWTTGALRAALTAYQRATGLDTLDGLTDMPHTPRHSPKALAMEPTAPALALVRTVLDTLELDGPPKHLTGRKGADAWRYGDWAIKTALPGARGDLAHEAAAYDLLRRQGRHPGVRHGHSELGRWLALPWVEGAPLWDLFAPAREGSATEPQRTQMREASRAALSALREFHATGWIHGDMQSENVIITVRRGVSFIDYDRAHHPDLPRTMQPYRGGLVHVIAPEIAARLLATNESEHVALTPQAELYALGASLYWAWTGTRITDYRGDPAGAHAELYEDIAAGRCRNLDRDRPWIDAELEGLIRGAVEPNPVYRTYGTDGEQT
ncbi:MULTISPECIES: hypothetical protein [unclassified Streptomyces]|uniref:hypothetical protein n=1 Tax=unclassified Streptomyces TaxID=2593676 RepID=UPI000939699F|nr:hypothetical protein [Streptomyces sp. TSRI0281]OKI48407.1 hypothetical protein A6A29_05155 [Streptomyces sp. TSRI0281]